MHAVVSFQSFVTKHGRLLCVWKQNSSLKLLALSTLNTTIWLDLIVNISYWLWQLTVRNVSPHTEPCSPPLNKGRLHDGMRLLALCVWKGPPRDRPYPLGFRSTGILPLSFPPCLCKTKGNQSLPVLSVSHNEIWGTSKRLSFEREKWTEWKIGLKCKCPAAMMTVSQLPREHGTMGWNKLRPPRSLQNELVTMFWDKLFASTSRYKSCCDEKAAGGGLLSKKWLSLVLTWNCWRRRRRAKLNKTARRFGRRHSVCFSKGYEWRLIWGLIADLIFQSNRFRRFVSKLRGSAGALLPWQRGDHTWVC